jgi:hypothetical protein
LLVLLLILLYAAALNTHALVHSVFETRSSKVRLGYFYGVILLLHLLRAAALRACTKLHVYCMTCYILAVCLQVTGVTDAGLKPRKVAQ